MTIKLGLTDPRISEIEAKSWASINDLRHRLSGTDEMSTSAQESLLKLNNLIELHAAAAAVGFVKEGTVEKIHGMLAQLSEHPSLNDEQTETLKITAEQIPSSLSILAGEVLGYRAGRFGAREEVSNGLPSLSQFVMPARCYLNTTVATPRLAEEMRGRDAATVVESWFERVHQTLFFACLEIAKFATSEVTKADAVVLEVLQVAREIRDNLLALTHYDVETSRKIFWQGDVQRDEYSFDHSVASSKTGLYYHHDRFRLGRLDKAREDFKMISDALLELGECYVTGESPSHPVSVNRFGLGSSIAPSKQASGMLPIVVMESIADEVEVAFCRFKQEALRTKSDGGKSGGFHTCADSLQYVRPHTTSICPDVVCRLYRGLPSDELLRQCVELANMSVRTNPLDPALSRGGLTVEVEFEKLSQMIAGKDSRLATIEVDGKVHGFELVVLGRDVLRSSDFSSYFNEHPFHLKKSGYLKLAIASSDLLKELIAREIRESPFDILHRRMTSELQARNQEISVPSHKTRYLLTQIRIDPVENRASVNAAMRNYGLKSGIVTSSVESDGIKRSLEFYLVPLSFSGFFNTHMNY